MFLPNCISRCNLKNTIICPHKSVQKCAHKYTKVPPAPPRPAPLKDQAARVTSLYTLTISMTRLTETDGEATHQTSSCCLSAPANGANKVSSRAGESFLQLVDRWGTGVRRPLWNQGRLFAVMCDAFLCDAFLLLRSQTLAFSLACLQQEDDSSAIR